MKVLLVFILLSFRIVYGQEEWTLQQCIHYALENNLSVASSQLDGASLQFNKKQAKNALLPTLNVSSNIDYSELAVLQVNEGYVPVQKTAFMSRIESQLELFHGFRKMNQIRKSALNEQLGRLNIQKKRQEIVIDILANYMQILLEMERLSILEQKISMTHLQLHKTKRLLELGQVIKGDVMDIETQLVADSLEYFNAENDLRISYLILFQKLGLENGMSVKIKKPMHEAWDMRYSEISIDSVFYNSHFVIPQFGMAQIEIERSNLELKMARLGRCFQLDAYGAYFVQDAQGSRWNESIGMNNGVNFGLRFRLPIYNQASNSIQIQKNKIQLSKSENSKKQVDLDIYRLLSQLKTELSLSHRKFLASEKAKKSLLENHDRILKQYELGMVSLLDFYNSRNRIIQLSLEAIQNKYEFKFKLAMLDFYQGRDVNI